MAESATLNLPTVGENERRRPFYVDVLVRLIKDKPLGFVGGIFVVGFLIMAIAAPLIAPYGHAELGAGARLDSPSASHIFGTDNLGRDVFSRVVYGARVSMTIGFLAVFTSTLVALTIGILSGYFGGVLDILSQRLVDAFMAFPALVFLIAVGGMFTEAKIPGLPDQGLFSTRVVVLIISLGILFGVGSSRIIRSATLSVKSSTYVEAARSTGATHTRLIFVHVLPNVMAPTITLATLSLGGVILAESGLSFLGLSVPPDQVTWGGMLKSEGRSFMVEAPWLAIFPGLALSLAVFGFNMLGDALRDLLDPRLRQQ
ncbi:MAG: ABC transporter permease [Chloroflexi bacterium]|nr:ABC transporter permease [Chloroflexota bacterium]